MGRILPNLGSHNTEEIDMKSLILIPLVVLTATLTLALGPVGWCLALLVACCVHEEAAR